MQFLKFMHNFTQTLYIYHLAQEWTLVERLFELIVVERLVKWTDYSGEAGGVDCAWQLVDCGCSEELFKISI